MSAPPDIPNEVVAAFLKELATGAEFSTNEVSRLEEILRREQKPKPDDILDALSREDDVQ